MNSLTIVDRLKELKNELGIESQKEMAILLKISESFYSQIENGKKPISKNILKRLVVLSRKPEEYWLYGITDNKEYLEKRKEFKCMDDAIRQLSSLGLLIEGADSEYTPGVVEVLTAALKADVAHILEKGKQKVK